MIEYGWMLVSAMFGLFAGYILGYIAGRRSAFKDATTWIKARRQEETDKQLL